MGARLLQPATLADADAAVCAGRATYLAGGTALQLSWPVPGTPTQPTPDIDLIDVRAWSSTHAVEDSAGSLVIGALTTLEALRTDVRVRARASLLCDACSTLGSLAVRHLGTLGGNVGWRSGDTVASLLALDARLEYAHGASEALADGLARTALPLIRALHVPVEPATFQFYEKVGHRAAFSPSRLALAGRFTFDADKRIARARIGASGAALPGCRLLCTEAWLAGGPAATLAPDDPGLRRALAEDLPGEPARVRLAARLLSGHLRSASQNHPAGGPA